MPTKEDFIYAAGIIDSDGNSYWDDNNPKHKPALGWHLYGEESRKFLLKILPFLIVKTEQAILSIKFQEEMNKNGTNGRTPSDSLSIREDLYQQCAMLNKRGRIPCHTA